MPFNRMHRVIKQNEVVTPTDYDGIMLAGSVLRDLVPSAANGAGCGDNL